MRSLSNVFDVKNALKLALASLVLCSALASAADDGGGGSGGGSGGGGGGSTKSGILLGVTLGVAFDRSVTDPIDIPITVSSSSSRAATLHINPDVLMKGVEIGLKVGYQHYFNNMLGVRGYLDYGFRKSFDTATLFSYTVQNNSVSYNLDLVGMGNRVDVNVDALIDVLHIGILDVGVIAGLFGGYNTITIDVASTNSRVNLLKALGMDYYATGQFGLNIGTQLTIANNHHIELLAKIPFNAMINENDVLVEKGVTIKSEPSRYYNVTVGYNFTF